MDAGSAPNSSENFALVCPKRAEQQGPVPIRRINSKPSRGTLVQTFGFSTFVQRAHGFSTSMSSTLTYSVKMDSLGGAPGEVLKRLPAMAAAFRAKGWYVQLIIEDAETMHEIILEQAEEQHKNDQKQKGTKERFDPSVFEPLPEGSRYVTEISIAPPWLRAAYSKLAPVSMSDFAHCKPTRTSMFGGITGGKIFQGGNMEVVDGVYTRWFGNEDEYACVSLTS